MVPKTFQYGGIHPYAGKDLSMYAAIEEVLPEGELVYPLSQNIGAPAKPIVKVKDQVLKGQKIAEAGGFVSAPIHSAVSGTVRKIEPRLTASGDMVESIVIESDGLFNEVEYDAAEDLNELSNEEIIARVKEAGIVGLGGAGFPTHVKLSPKEPDKIEYVIVNCAECEPYLTADYRRMVEMTEDLVEGLRLVLRLFPNARGVFAIENDKKEALQRLQSAVYDEADMSVCELEPKYPQGGERQIINAVTKRHVTAKMLPADVGCIVDNVETIYAIYHAVKDGMPLIKRVATITGDAIMSPSNILYSMGTSYKQIVEHCGGFQYENKEDEDDDERIVPGKIIAGGPMMGMAMFSLDVPMTKTASSLLCMVKDEVPKSDPLPCISCGKCVEACPQRLVPSRLAKFSERGQKAEFEKWYGMECIECGSCSYVCPSKIQVAQAVKNMKKRIIADNRKGAK
ncbi:MAG: electron transport complex subunit RsxC [Clostridiales bacterium]|nr:electron transport complex subunit RsxC [Clostridiales bacterium]